MVRWLYAFVAGLLGVRSSLRRFKVYLTSCWVVFEGARGLVGFTDGVKPNGGVALSEDEHFSRLMEMCLGLGVHVCGACRGFTKCCGLVLAAVLHALLMWTAIWLHSGLC